MKSKFTLFAVVLLVWVGVAQSEIGFSAYRGLDGQMSALSESNLQSMIDMAKEDGSVRVWVGFDLPFQADPALRTPEVVAAEAAAKKAAVAEIVAPLINQGKAKQIAANEATGAPGVMLFVNHNALEKLAKEDGVKYIGYLPDAE